ELVVLDMAGEMKKQQPFWLGRMQVMHQPKNILRTLVSFASRDGIPSLWTGLTGSWLRQCSYSTARFGLYNYFAKEVKQRTGTTKLTAGWEVVCSGVAGGAAGLVGNPTEVVLVRMCADGAKTAAERYNYGNSIRALYRIAKEEGMSTFSRGLTPNIVRSVIMTYSTAKDYLLSNPSLGLKDGIFLHFLASLLAGTVATTACAPADVLKSRVQSAPTINGVKPSLSKIFADSYKKEGISFLMRGWSPAWLRLASGQPKPVQEKKASEAMKA
ncbi:unnamed protein product, partial [Aureobasidium mustum]